MTPSLTTGDTLATENVPLILTIERAEQLLQERNPQLKMGSIIVDEAKATLRQERLIENPEVDILYNVYNPITRRYFDPGREGELDISVEQPISIGGQRRARIQRAQAVVAQTEYSNQWTAWLLRMDLHRALADVFFLQEKVAVFDTEVSSADRIIAAWKRQAEQGNVSRIEVNRMEALKMRLLTQQNEVADVLAERKKDLRMMLGQELGFEFRVDGVERTTTVEMSRDDVAFTFHSPLLMAKRHEAEAARHDLRLQRACALPYVSLKAEYDKNGNICRDFWGVGLSLTVPLFNRNQGNIRQSAMTLERLQMEEQTFRRQAEADVALACDLLQRRQQLLAETQQMALADWSPESMERQLMEHNLSLLEFIDLYDAWREARLQVIEAQHGVVLAAINLNEKAGDEIITLKRKANNEK